MSGAMVRVTGEAGSLAGEIEGDAVDNARNGVSGGADGDAVDGERRIEPGNGLMKVDGGVGNVGEMEITGDGQVAGNAGGAADESEASTVGIVDDAGGDADVGSVVDGGGEAGESVVGGRDVDGDGWVSADGDLKGASGLRKWRCGAGDRVRVKGGSGGEGSDGDGVRAGERGGGGSCGENAGIRRKNRECVESTERIGDGEGGGLQAGQLGGDFL